MKLLLYSIVILLLSLPQLSKAQDRECGTSSPERPHVVDPSLLNRRMNVTFPLLMKVFVHVVANDEGTSVAAGDSSINRQLENMRQFYAPQNICFILAGKQQINNLDLTAMNVSTEASELNPFLLPDMLNIFIHSTLFDTAGNLNGYAYSIPGSTLSLVDDAIKSITNRSTLAHEMGHNFGLYHTHETFNGTRMENVARSGNCSNCATAGDTFCDTEADPNLDNGIVVNASCNYTGTARDACSTLYAPNPRNIMAYGNRACRDFFSNEQGAKARSVILATPALTNSIAPEDLFVTSNKTISSGRQFLLARNVVQINTTQYVINGSARVDMSSNRIELKPGIRLTPVADGYVKIRPNTLCQ